MHVNIAPRTPVSSDAPASTSETTAPPNDVKTILNERFSRLVNNDQNKEGLNRLLDPKALRTKTAPETREKLAKPPVTPAAPTAGDPAADDTTATPPSPPAADDTTATPPSPPAADELTQLRDLNRQLLEIINKQGQQTTTPQPPTTTPVEQTGFKYVDPAKFNNPELASDPAKWWAEFDKSLQQVHEDAKTAALKEFQQQVAQQEAAAKQREAFFAANEDLKGLNSNPLALTMVTKLAQDRLVAAYGQQGLQTLQSNPANLSTIVANEMRKVMTDLGMQLGKPAATPPTPPQPPAKVTVRKESNRTASVRTEEPEEDPKKARFNALLNSGPRPTESGYKRKIGL